MSLQGDPGPHDESKIDHRKVILSKNDPVQ
jgi:hypothetical protein